MKKVVESVKISDGCMPELYGERLGLLEGRVKQLEVRIVRLEDDGELNDARAEESEDKLELLEERVAVLHVQNIELRNHLNSVIDMVNSVTQLLNNMTPQPDEQPTVQEVYDMYQSQPTTEEGWQEMTEAIKAAEEREAQPPQQLFKVINGLTPDQWEDLLQTT